MARYLLRSSRHRDSPPMSHGSIPLHLMQAQSQGPERFGTTGKPFHAAAEGQKLAATRASSVLLPSGMCFFCRTGIGPVHDAWQLITRSEIGETS